MEASAILGMNIPNVWEFCVAIVGVCTFAASCYALGRRKGSKADHHIIESLKNEKAGSETKLQSYQERFATLEATVKDPRDFWLRAPDPTKMASHRHQMTTSIPIICVVNFKGGVGKTTICANLAAHYAEKNKRVLLIDCDYQGSLSDTVLTHARVEKFRANAYKLLETGHDPERLRAEAERLSSIDSRMWIYPAFYGLSRTEIQMMFRWLIGQDEEIRYNLSDYLQSSAFKSHAETAYDIILIDAPPRLLTGVVNALVASTHVIVPSILDGQSHIATLNTISAIQQFKQKLNPDLQILGVLPSMVASAAGYNQREQEFIGELERQLPEFYGQPVPILKTRPIIRREELSKAGGSEIVYKRNSDNASTRELRTMFDNVGNYIDQKIRWSRPSSDKDIIAMPGDPKRSANA